MINTMKIHENQLSGPESLQFLQELQDIQSYQHLNQVTSEIYQETFSVNNQAPKVVPHQDKQDSDKKINLILNEFIINSSPALEPG